MGLFGYKKKDFENCNQKLNNQVGEMGRLTDDPDVREKLQCIRKEMNRCSFSKQARKNLKKIDMRIMGNLDTLIADLQKGSKVSFFAHSDIVLSTIKYSRTFGKETLSEEQRRHEEILAESRIGLESEYKDLEKIEADKNALIIDAKGLAIGAKRDSIKRNYDALTLRENAHKARIAEKIKIYNMNSEIINAKFQAQVYEKVPRVMNSKEFSAFVAASIKSKLKFDREQADYENEMSNFKEQMTPIGNSSTDSDFETRVLTEENAEALGKVENVNIAANENVTSDFDTLVDGTN